MSLRLAYSLGQPTAFIFGWPTGAEKPLTLAANYS